MMLVEEGKISLDDSIVKYFPDAPAAWKPILIKNLLSHTSGLSEYESRERTGPKGPFYLRLDFTEDELATKIEALPIEWAPATSGTIATRITFCSASSFTRSPASLTPSSSASVSSSRWA